MDTRKIARRVLARFIGAMEHDSPEAMKKYLHDHPDADRSKHTVKKPEKEEGGKAEGGSKGSQHGKFPDHVVEGQLGGKFKTKEEATKPGGALHNEAERVGKHSKGLGDSYTAVLEEAERTDGFAVNPSSMKKLKALMADAIHVGGSAASQLENIRDLTDWDDSDLAPLKKPAADLKKAGEALKAMALKAPKVDHGDDPKKARAVLNYVDKVKNVIDDFKAASAAFEKAAKG